MDFKNFISQITKFYYALTKKQKIIIASSVVAVVGFLVFLTLFTSRGNSKNQYDGYAVLFKNITPSASAQIISKLETDGVKYKLADENTILVPKENVYKERISVASLGIINQDKTGFELFDTQDFGSTREEQQIKFQRAIQGELAKTIESLEPIEKATVYIAFPKDSVFVERQTPPTASVVVKIRAGKKLNRKQIEGIKRIVAGSVPNLNPDAVKIVTQDGISLGDDGITLENELVAAQIQYKQNFENSYEQKIIDMISRFTGGTDKVTAKVSIEFDFSQEDSQSEVFDPNSVVRSEQTIEENREGKEPKDIGGVPGAVSNIGPVEGLDDGKLKEKYSKNVVNTNYEISKKITKSKTQYATIKRITAAVVVDGKYEMQKDEDGKEKKELSYVPLDNEELAQIKSLVEKAIGYDSARGDEVSVSNFEFKKFSPINKKEAVSEFAQTYIEPFLPVLKYIVALLILFLFYRKVILPFMEKMLANLEPEESEIDTEPLELEEETEDTLEKFKAARKRAEDELGINENFNEEDLKYDVLLEKFKLIASDRSEEIAEMIQNMIKSDSSFTGVKEL